MKTDIAWKQERWEDRKKKVGWGRGGGWIMVAMVTNLHVTTL